MPPKDPIYDKDMVDRMRKVWFCLYYKLFKHYEDYIIDEEDELNDTMLDALDEDEFCLGRILVLTKNNPEFTYYFWDLMSTSFADNKKRFGLKEDND